MVIDALADRIIELKNPTVVGLDPRFDMLPKFLRDEMTDAYGETPKAAAEAFYEFNRRIIDKIYDIVPAVKPQIAMYEQYGADGIAAYQRTIAHAKSRGMIVIGDVKRGDIASTASAYSDGHIGAVTVGSATHRVFDTDFITINPYLGYDAVEPFLDNCKRYGKGLFVLVKTSNASADVQDLITERGPVYEVVAELVGKWGAGLTGRHGYSSVCAVVGATHPAQARRIREILPNAFFLVPGYGSQGGRAEDLAACFDKKGLGVVVNNSRGIIFAYRDKYKDEYGEAGFDAAARQACIDMREDLQRVM